MKLIRIGQLLVAAVVLTQTHAFAQSEMVGPVAFSVGPDTGSGASTTVQFASFNTSLGTLNEVELNYTNMYATGSDDITNTSGTTGTYSKVFLDAFYTLTTSQGSYVADDFTTPKQSQTITSGNSYDFVENSGAVQSLPTVVVTTGLSAFEGSGSNISVTLQDQDPADTTGDSNTSWSVTTDNSFTSIISATGTGDLTVTYLYTVPEPSQTAGWMLGFGLVLLMGRSFLKKFEFGSLARQA
jgi:hypothetical protein